MIAHLFVSDNAGLTPSIGVQAACLPIVRRVLPLPHMVRNSLPSRMHRFGTIRSIGPDKLPSPMHLL